MTGRGCSACSTSRSLWRARKPQSASFQRSPPTGSPPPPARERLRRLRRDALVLQFGGAVGTLAVLNERGLDVAERLAALLDLPMPEAPWHSHRDRLAEVAAAFAILAGTCGKIARDVSL